MLSIHADFDYEIIDNVVVIYDLNKGNRSVTNDAEAILDHISKEIPSIQNKQVIYRDSLGIFDQFLLDEEGKFINFYSINETILEKAINKVKSHRDRKWVIQRCLNAVKNQYENWPGYSERLMNYYEMMEALAECDRKWPDYEFRGHVVEYLR